MTHNIILKGISYTYLRQVISIVLGIVSLPLMLNYFGVTLYAIWVLISSLVIYLSNISFGIPSAMMAMVAKEAIEDKKYMILQRSFYILLVISAAFLLSFGLVITMDKSWIVGLLGFIDDGSASLAINIFIVYVFFVLIKMPIALYAQFFIGMNKVYVSELYTIFTAVINFIALLVTIYFKYDVMVFVFLSFGSQLLVNFVAFFHVKLSYACLRGNKELFKCELNKRILKSGFSFLQVGVAAGLVWSTDNLVISHFLSVDDVTPYSIAFKIFTYTFLISATINGVIAPIYGNAHAVGDWKRIKRYSEGILNLLIVVSALTWVALIFFSKELIAFWTHNDSAFGGYLLFFSLGMYGYVLAYVNTYATVIYALNCAKNALRIVWAEALLNLCLSVLLVNLLDVGGVALATALAAFSTAFLYLPRVIKKLSNNEIIYDYRYTKKHFIYLVIPSVLLAIGCIFYIDHFFLKVLLFFIWAPLYIIYSWKLLNKEHKNMVMLFMKKRRCS